MEQDKEVKRVDYFWQGPAPSLASPSSLYCFLGN